MNQVLSKTMRKPTYEELEKENDRLISELAETYDKLRVALYGEQRAEGLIDSSKQIAKDKI